MPRFYEGAYEFPLGLTTIAVGAFCNCRKLLGLIGNNVNTIETIGDLAFEGCVSLYGIGPESIVYKHAVAIKNLQTIGDCAFKDCYNLHYVILNNTVTSVCNSACFGCFNLRQIQVIADTTHKYNYVKESGDIYGPGTLDIQLADGTSETLVIWDDYHAQGYYSGTEDYINGNEYGTTENPYDNEEQEEY